MAANTEGFGPLLISALAPLTAPGWVEAGRHLVAGLELGVSDVNASGGIAGRQIELIVRDTAGDPAKAAAAVDELASAGVLALAGEYHSNGFRRRFKLLIVTRRDQIAFGSFTMADAAWTTAALSTAQTSLRLSSMPQALSPPRAAFTPAF